MNKIESLQGLRGFAILMIMISHCCYLKNSGDVNALGMLGGLGVELFIILSGYLVCYWNFDKFTDDSRINAKSCIIRTLKKVKKYYLLHVITMLVAVIVQWESIGEFIHRLYKFIIDLLLLQAWYPNMGGYFSYNAVAWYLSCSTFFIFMTPYVIRYLRKLDTRQTLNLMTKIVAFEFVWALVMPQERISHWLIYVFPVIRLLDFVLGGCIFVLFKNTKDKVININKLVLSIMIFLIFVAIAGIEYYILEKDDVFYTVAPWSIPSILLIALLAKFHEFDTFFKFTPLVFLGNISFELFLWHLLVKQSVWLVNDKCILCYDEVMLSNITIVISVIIAYAYNRCSFKFISENYDRLYDKWILRER